MFLCVREGPEFWRHCKHGQPKWNAKELVEIEYSTLWIGTEPENIKDSKAGLRNQCQEKAIIKVFKAEYLNLYGKLVPTE